MTRLADSARDMRMLLVEDCQGDVLLFRRSIARLDLRIDLSVAASAEAALAQLKDAERPDLIVTDLNLPNMSGLDFLENVKSDPGLRRIPVLVVSSSTFERDITSAYDRQASGYFAKPVDAAAYSAMLETIAAYWRNLMQLPSERLPLPKFHG
ncbi:response regulator [Asticcacaulis solisilvae]|uniref:response regulator n=1 Tax=Asticcacaulis solisilvae TaxID=1217274 RepID=UPI003FD7E3D8